MRLAPLGKAQLPKDPEAKFEIWEWQFLPIATILASMVVLRLTNLISASKPFLAGVACIIAFHLAIFLFVYLLDFRRRYAISDGVFYHRFAHSTRSVELASVRRAEIIQGVLELEVVSGKIERFEFAKGSDEAEKKAKFLSVLEESLPVPLRKDTFLKDLVCSLGDRSKATLPAEWQGKMSSAIGEEVGRFPVKELWSAIFARKLTLLSTALFILTCIAFPVLTLNRVPALAYLTLLIPFGIATWLVRSKKVPTLDLVVGKGGLGIALGETFIFGEPYGQIKAFTFQASNSDVKRTFYWFQIETAHGTKITEEILVENPSSTKDLFFAKGQLPLREEAPEEDPRGAPKPWEAYLPAPNNTPRTK